MKGPYFTPYYFKVDYPPRNPNMEAAMGHFMVVWSVLETHLDSSIAVALCINPTLAMTVTANLGTKAKIDILHSAISMSAGLLDAGLVEKTHALLNKIADLSGSYRNLLAHGSATRFHFGWHWQRVSARKTLDVRYYPGPIKRWRKAASDVKKLTREWAATYQEIWHVLDSVDEEKRQRAYHFFLKSG